MKSKSILYSCILGLLMIFSSCVKDSDIEPKNTIESSSRVTSSLILSSFDASSFMDESTQKERLFRTETTPLELTNTTFLMEQLVQTNLTFKIKNSLEREFKIDVEFLNDLDELKFSLQIPVSAGTKEKPITVETNVIIEIPELATFKEATSLVYTISMLPDDKHLMLDSEGTLELQSDAAYFLDF